MRRFILGLLTLALIFSASLGNLVYLNMELSAVKATVEQSISASEDEAYELISNAYKRYCSTRNYKEIVLPENKYDTLAEYFLDSLNTPSDTGIKRRIINQLEGIINSEKLSLSSIF